MKKVIDILFFSRVKREEVWEYDFILKEILTDNVLTKTHFLSIDEVRSIDKVFDVFVYSCRDPVEYVWGYMPTYDHVLECVLKTKPKIIIQLSDEYKHENLEHHNELANYCDLMLRQHNHTEYRNTFFGTGLKEYKNLIHMPLGYLNDTKINRKDVLPINQRKYNWSFVGKIKDDQFFYYDYESSTWLPTTDRSKMIQIFSSNNTNFFFKDQGVSKNELVNIYNNSIFVPCGRGNTSLNCFRNYEATICGSIPVVASKFKDEIGIVFKFSEMPPWIFVNSWEEAIMKCNELVNNIDLLQKMQDENLRWWDSVIENIRRRVMYALFKK